MPIYEYRCDNGHTFEVMQRMSDDTLTTCSECGASVQRVFHPVEAIIAVALVAVAVLAVYEMWTGAVSAL